MTAVDSRGFPILLLLLTLTKLMLAALIPVFGDEAFYWQEGQALAFGYTDLPPLTALLAAAGTGLLGDHPLGLRWPFVLCGSAAIWCVARWLAWRAPAEATRSLWLVAAVPLMLTCGVLATPDAPLTLALLGTVFALDRALDQPQVWRPWIWVGFAMALAWLAHWRALVLYPAGVLLLLCSPRARLATRSIGFWIAQGIGALGLAPSLWFNWNHDFAALRFQAVDRHAFAFEPMALLQPLEQAVTVGVLLYPLLVIALWLAFRRRREAGFDVVFALAATMMLGYFVGGWFGDHERSRLHWVFPAYVVLAWPLSRAACEYAWVMRALPTARRVGLATGVVMLVYLLALPRLALPDAMVRGLGEPFIGWDEVDRSTRSALRATPRRVLVADNFLLAAQIDFAMAGQRPVYVLDHPRNVKHGRQGQLLLWNRHQSAALAQDSVLLVVEESALGLVDQRARYRALCQHYRQVRVIHDLLLADGKRFVWIEADRNRADAPTCRLPALGLLSEPEHGATLAAGSGFSLSGWILRDDTQRRLRLRIDGQWHELPADLLGNSPDEATALWPDQPAPTLPGGFYARGLHADLTAGAHSIEVWLDAPVPRLLDRRQVVVQAQP